MKKFSQLLLGAGIVLSTVVSTLAQADNVTTVVRANNRFGINLFKQSLAKDAGKNVFVSPVSATMALALLYNGSAGQTQSEIGQVLGLGAVNSLEVAKGHADLLKILNDGKGGFALSVANSIWADNTFKVRSEYVSAMEKQYASQVSNLDFNAPEAVAILNNWASEKTHGKINNVIDEMSSDMPLILMNATYFKADWTRPFPANATHEGEFKSAKGIVERKFMNKKDYLKHLANESFEAVELPYGPDENASLIVVLPSAKFSDQQINGLLSIDNFEKLSADLDAAELRQGFLKLPKFKFEYKVDLEDILKNLGMIQAFGHADFSRLSDERGLAVNKALQKTFVAVDEKGTEAAAVTVIGVGRTAVEPGPRFQMVVDRPFLIALKDKRTGTLLFLGSIADPLTE